MITTADLRSLHGKIVLVKSASDTRNPPSAMRGWIEVHEEKDLPPEIRLAVEFPQMFTERAHHRTITLDQAALDRLLASQHDGVFEFTLEEKLGWSD